MTENLEVLYTEAQSALNRREYERAAELLTQIIAVDENYKDVSRLLAQVVRLKRRRWYNHPALWTVIAIAAIIGSGVWILPRLPSQPAQEETSAPAVLPISSPVTTMISTPTNIPTIMPSPALTAIPLMWKRIYMGQEFPRDTVTGLVVDPDDPDLLFAETQHAGIYKSINGGISWSPAQKTDLTDSQAGRLSLASHSITQHKFSNTAPDGIKRLYQYENLDETSSTYWFVSEDNGATWKRFSEGGTFTEFTPIAFDGSGFVYVFCGRNICKYAPDGTPSKILKQPDIQDQSAIVVLPADPNIIYAAGNGISVSKDGGSTWTKLNDGMGSDVLRLSAGNGAASFLYIQLGECFTQTNNEGLEQPLYRSTDGGVAWQFLTNKGCYLIKDADNNTLYRQAEMEHYPYFKFWMWRSSNAGKSWTKIPLQFATSILISDPVQSGVLYAQQNPNELNGFLLAQFRSEDYGSSWEKVSSQPRFLCHEVEGQFVNDLPPAIDPRDSNHVFFVSGGRLQETFDGCVTNRRIAARLPAGINSIAIDPANSKILYVGSNSGAYISYDAGTTWGQVNDGLLGATVVYSIAVDKDGKVYAATPYGVFTLEKK